MGGRGRGIMRGYVVARLARGKMGRRAGVLPSPVPVPLDSLKIFSSSSHTARWPWPKQQAQSRVPAAAVPAAVPLASTLLSDRIAHSNVEGVGSAAARGVAANSGCFATRDVALLTTWAGSRQFQIQHETSTSAHRLPASILDLEVSVASNKGDGCGSGRGENADRNHLAVIPGNAAISSSIAETYKYWGAPVMVAVAGLEMLHDSSGLTWTPVIAIATVAVRVCLLPVSIFSERNSRLFSEQVSPRFGKLWKDLTPEGGSPKTMAELSQRMPLLLRGLRQLYVKHECPPWKTLLSPLIQLPVFVTLSWGVREIAHSASHPELRTEGMLWFQDLTGSAMYGFLRWNLEDPTTYYLPVISTALLLINVELSLGDKLPWLKRVLQVLPLVTAPFTYQLPQAVFVYWIASFLFTTAQILAHRHPLWTKMVTYGHPPPPFLAPPIASVTVNRPADGPAMIEEQDDEVAGMMHWAAKAEEVAQGFQARLRHVEEAYAEDDARLEMEREAVMNECMAYEDAMSARMRKSQELAQAEASEEKYKEAHTRYMVERMIYEEKVVLHEIIRAVREALGKKEGGGKDDSELASAVAGEIQRQRGEGGCLVALPPMDAAVTVQDGEAKLVLRMKLEDPVPVDGDGK